MSRVYIGIDPGKQGALVALNADGDLLLAERTPLLANDYDPHAMQALIERARRLAPNWNHSAPPHICIEKVSAMPKDGRAGIFSFGTSFGLWWGLAVASGASVHFATPQKWQMFAMRGRKRPKGKVSTKPAIVAAAKDRWPAIGDAMPFKRDYGKADAAWIAEYARSEILIEQRSMSASPGVFGAA